MPNLDEHGRPQPPPAADETEALLGFLEFQRATLTWRTSGLDAAGLNTTVGVSTMTLGGMLKHLAWVEDYWFAYWLHGLRPQDEFAAHDWAADPDWDWTSAAVEPPDLLRSRWGAAVERSREHTSRALADNGMATLAKKSEEDLTPNLRWIVTHMIEEYARHNGHADLIRESIDGQVGE